MSQNHVPDSVIYIQSIAYLGNLCVISDPNTPTVLGFNTLFFCNPLSNEDNSII
jgi:hypothetical protein